MTREEIKKMCGNVEIIGNGPKESTKIHIPSFVDMILECAKSELSERLEKIEKQLEFIEDHKFQFHWGAPGYEQLKNDPYNPRNKKAKP